MYKFTRFGVAAPKQPHCPVVNVVNNRDGTSTLTASECGNFIYGALVNQLLQ
jgi:hypothetical protein